PNPANPAASAAAATVAMPDPATSSGLSGWVCIGWVIVDCISALLAETAFSDYENVVTMSAAECPALVPRKGGVMEELPVVPGRHGPFRGGPAPDMITADASATGDPTPAVRDGIDTRHRY